MNTRLKDLDGLRGVAVLIVMVLHVFKRASYFTKNPLLLFITSLTSIGWVGVDIFFVLSGFLITSILLQSKNEVNYYRNFYARRALRIIPLYLALIIFVLFFAPKVEPEFMAQLPRFLPAILLYLQNWLLSFGELNITQYILVTWSLAIEEQFYLVWPFIVFRLSKPKLIKVGLWFIAISFLVRILSVVFWGNIGELSKFFYYNSFTRFEQLIMGGLLAVFFTYEEFSEKIHRFSMPSFFIFLSIFLLLCLMSLPGLPNPNHSSIPLTIGAYTTSALFSASLIGVFVTHAETNPLRRFFENKILVFFGKYSFSMYLFHVPVALVLMEAFWHTKMRGWWVYLLYIASTFIVTMLIALLTWNLLEKHFLHLKKYFENK